MRAGEARDAHHGAALFAHLLQGDVVVGRGSEPLLVEGDESLPVNYLRGVAGEGTIVGQEARRRVPLLGIEGICESFRRLAGSHLAAPLTTSDLDAGGRVRKPTRPMHRGDVPDTARRRPVYTRYPRHPGAAVGLALRAGVRGRCALALAGSPAAPPPVALRAAGRQV